MNERLGIHDQSEPLVLLALLALLVPKLCLGMRCFEAPLRVNVMMALSSLTLKLMDWSASRLIGRINRQLQNSLSKRYAKQIWKSQRILPRLTGMFLFREASKSEPDA